MIPWITELQNTKNWDICYQLDNREWYQETIILLKNQQTYNQNLKFTSTKKILPKHQV
nr:hypothetical protein Itr_chr02CG09170 [Ipomoea trifida]